LVTGSRGGVTQRGSNAFCLVWCYTKRKEGERIRKQHHWGRPNLQSYGDKKMGLVNSTNALEREGRVKRRGGGGVSRVMGGEVKSWETCVFQFSGKG